MGPQRSVDWSVDSKDRARREAWGCAMEGFQGALTVVGLSAEDRSCLFNCYRGAAELSGRLPRSGALRPVAER